MSAALFGGVETGGTWCVCALGTGPGELAAREQFATRGPAETLDQIAGFFERHDRPHAIGVGSFGPVDVHRDSPTWGFVTTTPKPGWRHIAVAPVLEERLGVPVAFESDVTAAAIGEHRWGAGRDVGALCYLTIGTGIGAGLLVDGRPLRGLIHPEVGHLRIPHDRERDPFAGSCPSHGDCWEGLAAGGAVAQRWHARPEDLADDHPAWELEAEYVALGIWSIVAVASPERIVVGGGVMDRPRLLADVCRRVSALEAGYLGTPRLGEEIDEYIVPPELGDDAGVLGAIALAQESLLS